jgi:hypothetical protein
MGRCMRIACLAWGSLVWKPGVLPVSDEWSGDGPRLPIEFSRVADGGELSTAICLNAPSIPVLWTSLQVDSVAQACAALRQREQIPPEREDGVGWFIPSASNVGELAEWAQARGIDAVIWTALPPRIAGMENRLPSVEDAVDYLAGLTGDACAHARHYIEQVPAQIDTPYRRAIRHQLGW